MALSEVLQKQQASVGEEVHVSEWLTISQEMIDTFAEATGDHQWIHVDQERAAAESPFGGTIAHGYLTLSLYPLLRGLMAAGEPVFPGTRSIINYGLNKVRFPRPVMVGSDVRLRWKVLNATERLGRLIVNAEARIEVRGERKPALVAETITMFVVE